MEGRKSAIIKCSDGWAKERISFLPVKTSTFRELGLT